MVKRLNPQRRLLARQGHSFRVVISQAKAPTTPGFEQGHVRSHMSSHKLAQVRSRAEVSPVLVSRTLNLKSIELKGQLTFENQPKRSDRKPMHLWQGVKRNDPLK